MAEQQSAGQEIIVHNRRQRSENLLRKWVITEQLFNLPGLLLFIVIGLVVGYGIGNYGTSFGGTLIAIGVAIPGVYCIAVYARFGVVVLLVMAYMLFLLMRLGVPGPLGTMMDALQLILLLNLLVRQKKNPSWGIFKSPATIVVLCWIAYNLVEVANPAAESRLAWVYTVRTVAMVQLSYFIFMYNIRSVKFIRFLLKLWMLLALIGALYAFKQEFIGFSDAEEAYLHSDPNIASLLFIAGHWRKFSIFSDPVAFSYNMVMPCILCVCVMFGKFSGWKKVVCFVLIGVYFLSMLYSGTRGANVLLPAALVLFAILNYNKNVLVFSIIAAIFFAILIVIPTGNPTIQRFQTAFKPNDDDSYKVRKNNQKRIQPYILTHPMGGGLGATGAWGQRFAPGSFLAHFPPDSGYIRVAVENGSIGLILFCTMVFVFLKTGIDNYYAIRDPELKTYCLMATLVIFAYNIANFPQEALVQYPSNILFLFFVALVNITRQLDDEKNRNMAVAVTV
ncbi:O-antigen ligase family protein [Mucilaginibacter sp. RS28]|uniref:O-antigen ligase family protein n=1 Tax=Mucilaginibacter straminoryzae TaxID=2932774 RepID=A0A9X1X6F8_9SPHI|nr:O-antigen ligase family protein [Mucilaginibacter straminoryzae]MCJ8211826.1 O-antigen ligase family protein [Mucilaginibacter straminoryzae]